MSQYIVIHLFKEGCVKSIAVEYNENILDHLKTIRGEYWIDAGHSPIDRYQFDLWQGEKLKF